MASIWSSADEAANMAMGPPAVRIEFGIGSVVPRLIASR
jgi:hypothetical protein